MDEVARQKRHFEEISERYLRSRQHTNHLLFKKLLWQLFLKDAPFPHRRLSVLEPMCGYAEGKKILEEHGGLDIEYVGFDYSEPLVAHVKRNDPSLNVSLMDVTRFESGPVYDLVMLLGGLHHVPRHTVAVIGRMHDALREGGYFISFEPTHNNFIFRKIREHIYRRNNLFDAETEEAFELGKLDNYFHQNGFRLVRQMYPGLLAYVLYYNPDAFPWLNRGSESVVRTIFNLEKSMYANIIGRKFSFATLSLWQKA